MLKRTHTVLLTIATVLLLGGTIAAATAPRLADPLSSEREGGTSSQEAKAWPSGIFDTSNRTVAYNRQEVRVENVWQQDFGGHHVQVYAGQVQDDEAQGVVIVKMIPLGDTKAVRTEGYFTADRHGALKIVREQGRLLTLEAADGTHYAFDVDRHELKETH